MIREKILKILSISFILILSIIHLNSISLASITQDQNKGKIQISNLEEGVNVSLYQITTMEYDWVANQPKEGYQWKEEIQNWLQDKFPKYTNTEKFYQELNGKSEEIKVFYDTLTAAIRENTIPLSVYQQTKAVGETRYPVTPNTLKGVASFSEVEMGTYLVIIENGYMVYTPSVINVVPSFDENSKQWVLEEQNVVVKATNPGIVKTVTNEEKSVDNYSTVDFITYTIKADVPTYLPNSLSKKYVISDKLDDSFTIQEDSLMIYGLQSGKEPESIMGHTIKFNTTRPNSSDEVTFLIDFDYDTISSYEEIKIVYTAKLNQNESLVLGKEGNNNYSYLDYSNNPYLSSSIQTQATEKVSVYTYGIEIQSVDGENKDTPILGSEFSITDTSGNPYYFVKGEDGQYYLADSEEEGATTNLVVDENGNLWVKGLDEGTYLIEQTKAPEGYHVSSKIYQVDLVDQEPDGELEEEYTLIFPNTKGFTLPVTGGIGIIALVGIGTTILGIGICLLISICKRRKILSQDQK